MGRSHVQNGQISEQIDGVNGNAVFPLFRVVEGSFPHVVELGGNINDHVEFRRVATNRIAWWTSHSLSG